MTALSPFIQFSSSELIIQTIQYAIGTLEPRRIHSAPGMGKTTTLKEYANYKPAVYCEVGHCDKDVGGMFRMLIKALSGYASENSNKRELAEKIAFMLENEYRPEPYFNKKTRIIIIDEYQTFETTALRELLRLQEQFHFPLILSGNLDSLAKRTSCANANKQNSSRAGPITDISPPTLSDCNKIADYFNLNNTDTRNVFVTFANGRDLRTTYKMIKDANFMKQSLPELKVDHLLGAIAKFFATDKKGYQNFLIQTQQAQKISGATQNKLPKSISA